MKRIAFDLDGVLVPDFDHIPSITTEAEYYEEIQAYIIPLFEPKGKWYLLTGRSQDVAIYTRMWIDNNFNNPPVEILHGIENDESPIQYKARMIEEHNITHYIESSKDIVEALRKQVNKCEVIHFSQYIANIIDKELK